MNGIALQIDGKWAVLPDDVSISIEEHSPLWEEAGTFSYPFELDIEPNRHILGNSDQITGESVYKTINKKRAVLYVSGLPFVVGQVSLDDEMELSEGRVEINIISGKKPFEEMIDGMNCRDVELIDRIEVGECYPRYAHRFYEKGTLEEKTVTGYYPNGFMMMTVNGVSTANVSMPYPFKPYCNMSICYQLPDEEDTVVNDDVYASVKTVWEEKIKNNIYGRYFLLDEKRANAGLCFYVLYFLDCLFDKLGISLSNKDVLYMEDLCRLAFFMTNCAYDTEFVAEYNTVHLRDMFGYVESVSGTDGLTPVFIAEKHLCIANSKNFPDEDVSSVIESLQSGFGIRFLFDKEGKMARMVFVKDVLSDKSSPVNINADVFQLYKVENSVNGFRIRYSAGSDDDTSYNYNEWKNVKEITDYNQATDDIMPYNKTLYIDTTTGNAYRVKVDESAENEGELNPALFEVGAFNSFDYGDCSDEDLVEIVEVPFTPIIMNDVNFQRRRSVRESSRRGESSTQESSNDQQILAAFLDVEMQYPSFVPWIKSEFYFQTRKQRYVISYKYSFANMQRWDETYHENKLRQTSGGEHVPFSMIEQSSPIAEYDTGLTLGVMRGPGSDGIVEYFAENYDGENNSRWVETAKNPAFSSDMIDNYGRMFDYNGSEAGGVDTSGRFSLKLKAEKPNPDGGYYPITETYAQKRGLFDKFHAEYAYFVTHRKIARMTCHIEMADLVNIDWTKRYKIGGITGFIKSYSYSVTSDGVGDVELEMYYI